MIKSRLMRMVYWDPYRLSSAVHSEEGIWRLGFRIAKPHLFRTESRGSLMLSVNVENFGDVVIFRCQGRLVSDREKMTLRNAVVSRANQKTLVLDLAAITALDADGLGVLLGLQAWTRANGNRLQLMNLPNPILRMLEVTNLERVFEICSEGTHPLPVAFSKTVR